MRGRTPRGTVVTLLGEIVSVLLVLLIVFVARRYSVSDPPTGQPPTGSSDADVAQLVSAGRTIDAIKVYRKLHGTDLKTAKDAIDGIRAQQAGARVGSTVEGTSTPGSRFGR
jgi:ribosomal protein L7/L12